MGESISGGTKKTSLKSGPYVSKIVLDLNRKKLEEILFQLKQENSLVFVKIYCYCSSDDITKMSWTVNMFANFAYFFAENRPSCITI